MRRIVILGGGFAGVETVGAINDLARESLPHYGRIDPQDVRVVLIHGGKVILPELGEALGLYAEEKLRKRQVDIKLGARVTAYVDGVVHCDDGELPAGRHETGFVPHLCGCRSPTLFVQFSCRGRESCLCRSQQQEARPRPWASRTLSHQY